ncbi:MAG TPA: hypothetical protein VHW65_02040 [Gemmatimonadales bacterium]|jgi:hypothetical protein|nr:hypothetical protein [Gemmatimonadales bacterium]
MSATLWRIAGRAVPAALVVAGLTHTPLAAQGSSDEARLVVGMSAGWIGGSHLWSVNSQTILTQVPNLNDIYALSRDIRSDLSISGQMTYYRGDHLGLTGEFTYIGLGTTDNCTLVQASGDPNNAAACTALNNTEHAASAVTVAGGVVYRPFGRSSVQPYFRAIGGLALMPRSTLLTFSDFTDNTGADAGLLIYDDEDWTQFRPTGTLGFGLATAPSQGYQLRIEARETWVRLESVTGPTAYQTLTPGYRSFFKGFPSVMVGFDIVLEKSRGRRY